jgi:hypothetical protein
LALVAGLPFFIKILALMAIEWSHNAWDHVYDAITSP